MDLFSRRRWRLVSAQSKQIKYRKLYVKPWISLVEGDKGNYRPNCQSNLVIVIHELTLLLCNFMNRTACLLGKYEPSSYCTAYSTVCGGHYSLLTATKADYKVLNFQSNTCTKFLIMGHTRSLFGFTYVFSNKHHDFCSKYMWKMSIQTMLLRFEPTTYGTRASSHNTRPGLPSPSKTFNKIRL